VDRQADLFGAPAPVLPEGFALRESFIDAAEEAALLRAIDALPLEEAVYRQYTARRRIASFGSRYDFAGGRLLPADPLPAFLGPLRERAARWAGVEPEAFSSALVAEYRPGTPLGWHRDVPEHELIFGVSLASAARMRLRRWPPVNPRKADVISVELPPRSAYVLRGVARWGWQHSIAPTKALRYSVTLRTRKV